MILLIYYSAVVFLLLSVAFIRYYAEIYLWRQIRGDHFGEGLTDWGKNYVSSKTSCK